MAEPLQSLSGGKLQQLLFARVLVQNAEPILLDNAFNGIDDATTRDLMSLISRWQAEGRTGIAIINDLAFMRAQFLLIARRAVGRGPRMTVSIKDNISSRRLVTAAPPGAMGTRLRAAPHDLELSWLPLPSSI